ncbi:MAG: hypothetical protein AAFQ14_09500 [Cyanobacteria bacterium J06621_12]
MIIFGTRSKIITGEPVKEIVCQHCGHEAHISFGVLRYFHLYWIPTFPYARKTGLECLHCKQTIFDNEIPIETQYKLYNRLFTRKTVWSTYIGLMIIGFIPAIMLLGLILLMVLAGISSVLG